MVPRPTVPPISQPSASTVASTPVRIQGISQFGADLVAAALLAEGEAPLAMRRRTLSRQEARLRETLALALPDWETQPPAPDCRCGWVSRSR